MVNSITPFTDHNADDKISVEMTEIPQTDLRKMAQALGKSNDLLGLSPITLQLLDPYLGLPLLDLLVAEFEHHIDKYTCEGGRYDGSDDEYYTAPIRDLQSIRALPGGVPRALHLLPLVCEKELQHNTNQDWYEWSMEDSTNIDEAGYSMLQELLRDERRVSPYWEIDQTFAEMAAQRTKWRQCEEKEREEFEDLFDRDSLPVFEKSLRLLRAWHTREVGAMLSMKVAGHLLPPELVENIAENFVDDEVLKVLEK